MIISRILNAKMRRKPKKFSRICLFLKTLKTLTQRYNNARNSSILDGTYHVLLKLCVNWNTYYHQRFYKCLLIDISSTHITRFQMKCIHYNDVIISAIASQITSLTIVYLTVYSDADKKKTPKLHVTDLYEGNSPVTSELPTQRPSNAEMIPVDDVIMGKCVKC